MLSALFVLAIVAVYAAFELYDIGIQKALHRKSLAETAMVQQNRVTK